MESWNIADAKSHFSTVIKEVENEPQVISRRNKPVAVLMNIDEYNEVLKYSREKSSIRDAIQELRLIQKSEKQVIDIPERQDREIEF
jgi:prevent-host-death family protein